MPLKNITVSLKIPDLFWDFPHVSWDQYYPVINLFWIHSKVACLFRIHNTYVEFRLWNTFEKKNQPILDQIFLYISIYPFPIVSGGGYYDGAYHYSDTTEMLKIDNLSDGWFPGM